jgi:teichuronic acid biosynthesis glycosyltransferase TuaG
MPLVSVVMPSYNYEEFIAESIESVLGQDFDDLELIIVDASTDSSRQIIQKYVAKDHRIQVILHEYNKGISKAINDGFEKARGRFIAHIDSDDVWVADKLTKQLAVLEHDEDLIVWSEGEIIDRKGQPVGKSFSEFRGCVSKKKSGDMFQELVRGNYIFASSLLFKKTNLGEIRRDESLIYLNDYKFVLDLARKYEFYYSAEPLAKYRLHGSNISSSSEGTKIARREYISILEESIRKYDREITRETKANMYATFAGYHYHRGEKKKSLRFLLQALRYNPSYPKLVLQRTLSNLLGSRT